MVGGATAGAALGKQIVGGSGKVIATLAGTIAGRKIQDNVLKGDVVTSTEKQCYTQYTTSEKVFGYNVTCKVAGAPTTIRMKSKPAGKTFPTQDGKVVLPK